MEITLDAFLMPLADEAKRQGWDKIRSWLSVKG